MGPVACMGVCPYGEPPTGRTPIVTGGDFGDIAHMRRRLSSKAHKALKIAARIAITCLAAVLVA